MITNVYENADRDNFYSIAKENDHDKLYPYAVDVINYFIYGDKDIWNFVKAIGRGEGGRGHSTCLEDDTKLSEIMLDYEYSWREFIDELNEEIANLPLRNGDKVCDWY